MCHIDVIRGSLAAGGFTVNAEDLIVVSTVFFYEDFFACCSIIKISPIIVIPKSFKSSFANSGNKSSVTRLFLKLFA